ncbi:MAG: FeoB-associated Cys-rich membrane protein [Tractidigestivibacter sp.]|jgi:hypothetical protein|uniref:FeoB-associated Cys-rich membrane protein n=1 Tax=Tractidigestivibacter sp. TaxID=2847320 RepID=UPI003D8D2AA4
MSFIDVVIIAAVALAAGFCVRSLVHSRENGCSSCGETGCSARYTGGRCRVADDMVRRADQALSQQGLNEDK